MIHNLSYINITRVYESRSRLDVQLESAPYLQATATIALDWSYGGALGQPYTIGGKRKAIDIVAVG